MKEYACFITSFKIKILLLLLPLLLLFNLLKQNILSKKIIVVQYVYSRNFAK